MSNYEGIQKKGLGRGLGSLLGEVDILEDAGAASSAEVASSGPAPAAAQVISDEARIWMVGVEKVRPNSVQPRKEFDQQKLKELADSIKEKGILQPIVVRKMTHGFEIIAGERRWRAAQLAGMHEVPIIIRKSSDQDSLELALIENIQRHDLNPIDEAEAYELLVKRFGLTQEQISQKVGKDRATIANSLRLLFLTEDVKKMVRDGALSTGHAKVILASSDPARQLELAKKCVNLRLSVRALESLVKSEQAQKGRKAVAINVDVAGRLISNLSEELQKSLGTKVQIEYSEGKGKVSVHFYSDDELTQIVERLRGTWKN